MKKSKIVIVIAILALIIAFGGFWLWKDKTEDNKIQKQESQEQIIKKEEEKQTQISQEQEIDTSNWKTYRDEKFGFEIKYPEEWEMRETHPAGIGGKPLSIIIDKKRNDTSMSIVCFESNKNPKEWYNENGIGFGGLKFENEYLINGYNVYYVREDNKYVYLNHDYLISDNHDEIIYFSFMEKYRKFNQETKQYDETSFSQYLPAFEAMVNSIKFID